MFGPESGPNKDPLLYDSMFFLPVILEILNTNPDLIEILKVQEGESSEIYTNRISTEINKCN